LLERWDEEAPRFAWVRSANSEGAVVGDAETEAEEWPELLPLASGG
jgi:hypothetical protein